MHTFDWSRGKLVSNFNQIRLKKSLCVYALMELDLKKKNCYNEAYTENHVDLILKLFFRETGKFTIFLMQIRSGEISMNFPDSSY